MNEQTVKDLAEIVLIDKKYGNAASIPLLIAFFELYPEELHKLIAEYLIENKVLENKILKEINKESWKKNKAKYF